MSTKSKEAENIACDKYQWEDCIGRESGNAHSKHFADDLLKWVKGRPHKFEIDRKEWRENTH